MQGLLPSSTEARKSWEQGLQVLPAPEPGPKSAIRTNPHLSLGWYAEHQTRVGKVASGTSEVPHLSTPWTLYLPDLYTYYINIYKIAILLKFLWYVEVKK